MAYSKIRIVGHNSGTWCTLVESVSFSGDINEAVKALNEVLYQYSIKSDENPVIKIENGDTCTTIRVGNFNAFCVVAY